MNAPSQSSRRQPRRFTPKTVLAVLASGVLTCGLFCPKLGASQIDGSVLFSGIVATSGDSSPGTTTISFVNPGWSIVSGLGNYTMSGTSAQFTTFRFSGTGTGATLLGSEIPEGTFVFGALTYSFELLALCNATITNGTMVISGTGIAHITGFDDTPASWLLEGSGQNFTFYSSTGSNADPPETTPDTGSAISLLAIALVGLEALRRRVRSA